MRIVIINLSSAKERLQFQQKQFKQLGLTFERFKAITPKTLPENIDQDYWKTWQRPLSLGERACLLSHRATWKMVKESNQPMLILEDDVLLSKQLPDLLKSIDDNEENTLKIQHLNLEVRTRQKQVSTKPKKLHKSFNVFRIYQDRTGAAAYILWPEGAKELLNITKKKAGLADAIICAAYNMNSYQIEPAFATQFDTCDYYELNAPFDTNSATHGSPKVEIVNFPQKILYRLRRISSQFSLGFRYLSKLPASNKRYIHLEKSDF